MLHGQEAHRATSAVMRLSGRKTRIAKEMKSSSRERSSIFMASSRRSYTISVLERLISSIIVQLGFQHLVIRPRHLELKQALRYKLPVCLQLHHSKTYS